LWRNLISVPARDISPLGSDGSIDIDKLRQLLNYVMDEYRRTYAEKKAILVGNPFRN